MLIKQFICERWRHWKFSSLRKLAGISIYEWLNLVYKRLFKYKHKRRFQIWNEVAANSCGGRNKWAFDSETFVPTAVAETQSARLTPHRDCGKVRWGFADANCFARFFSATLFIYGTLSRGAGWELCLRARYNYIVIYKERLTKTIPLRWMKREARYQPNIVYNFIKKQVE